MGAFDWVHHGAAITTAVVMALLAAVVASHQIYEHLSKWTHGHLQKYVTRILLLVPIYSVCSCVSLLVGDPAGAYMDVLRDAYEGYVLYQFMALLIALCGGEQELVTILADANRPQKKDPLHKVDRHFINLCRKRVLQYAFVKPILALATVLFMAVDVYQENDYSLDSVYLYIILAYNVSLTVSLYYLLLFGWELAEEFRYFTPTTKFLCIKSVIFFAFWQGLAISLMSKTGILGKQRHQGGDAEETAKALNNFLICIEMLGIAVLHHTAFSYRRLKAEVEESPYFVFHAPKLPPAVAAEGRKRIVSHLKAVLNVSDIVQDGHLAFVKGTRGALLDHDGVAVGEEELEPTLDPAARPELVIADGPLDHDDLISDGEGCVLSPTNPVAAGGGGGIGGGIGGGAASPTHVSVLMPSPSGSGAEGGAAGSPRHSAPPVVGDEGEGVAADREGLTGSGSLRHGQVGCPDADAMSDHSDDSDLRHAGRRWK